MPKAREQARKMPKAGEPWSTGRKILWETLEHNGVVFPPDYEVHGRGWQMWPACHVILHMSDPRFMSYMASHDVPSVIRLALLHGIPLVYDGKEVELSPHEEEVATFFAVMKAGPHTAHRTSHPRPLSLLLSLCLPFTFTATPLPLPCIGGTRAAGSPMSHAVPFLVTAHLSAVTAASVPGDLWQFPDGIPPGRGVALAYKVTSSTLSSTQGHPP